MCVLRSNIVGGLIGFGTFHGRFPAVPQLLVVRPFHAMNIFYGKSAGKADVPSDAPVAVSFDGALGVFRGLDPRSGFMGISLGERFVLQLAHRKHGRVRIELLDTSIPAFDACDVELEFAERLIRAAAEGHDVFQIASAGHYEWEHLDMA